MLLWRRQKLQQKRLFNELIHRFSAHQRLLGNPDRARHLDLRDGVIRAVVQQPAVVELIVGPAVGLSIGLVK